VMLESLCWRFGFYFQYGQSGNIDFTEMLNKLVELKHQLPIKDRGLALQTQFAKDMIDRLLLLRLKSLNQMLTLSIEMKKSLTPYHWLLFQLVLSRSQLVF